MLQFGAFEAKNKLGALLDRVENGEEILITRHGKPVAQLVRPRAASDRAAADAAYARMRAEAQALHLGPFNWEEYKAMRDEGRR